MNELTPEQWQKIDALIIDDSMIAAIRLYRELVNVSLMIAVDELQARRDSLNERHLIAIPTSSSLYETSVQGLDKINDKIVVIEGSWDGDSDGWFIRIAAIADHPSPLHPKFTEYGLCLVRDVRDQANMAKEIGGRLARRAKVDFYLTDDDPDFSVFDYEKRWWDTAYSLGQHDK